MPSDAHENAAHSSAISSSKAYFFEPYAPDRSRLRRERWPLAWPVSPPYDTSDITALFGVRVVVEVLGSLIAHGKLGGHKTLIDKPVSY
jgi:hypothetical protein